MLAEALVFDKFHRVLAEIEPEVESCSWRLGGYTGSGVSNGVGMTRIALPWSDDKCTTDILKPGNRLLLRFDDGLPAWGGVLDVPIRVTPGRTSITGYTGEKVLDWRVTPKARYFNATAPGTIFRTLLEEEAIAHITNLTIGEIYTGGDPRSLEYHYHDLLRRVEDLVRLTGEEWAVVPSYSGGVLTLTVNWYSRRGVDRSAQVWLVEGCNVTGEPTLDIQGPIHNAVRLAGAGDTWGDERITYEGEDADSIAEYDYREYGEIQSGVVSQATLDYNGAAILDAYKQPSRILTLPGVVDLAPATFASYDVGDIVTASLFVESDEWYYEGSVRILAREWRADNTCRLEVVEWT